LQRKRNQQQPGDTELIYGPPDKQQHFLQKNEDDFKVKGKNRKDSNQSKKPKIVKAKYDGEWFTGELNEDIDQWTIYFEEDDYTDYVTFTDKDVKIQKVSSMKCVLIQYS